MEVQSPAAKRHYDITMSRRTRKQQQQQRQQQQQFSVQGNEKTKSTMDDDEATPKDADVHVTVETKATQTVSVAGEVKGVYWSIAGYSQGLNHFPPVLVMEK